VKSYPGEVMVDSSAFLALYNSGDPAHKSLTRSVNKLAEHRSGLITTNFILSEAYTLIGCRLSFDDARTWLKKIDVPVEYVSPADEEDARQILQNYDDKEFSYVDATTFTVMERLQIKTALTLDSDFEQYGFQVLN